MEQYRIVTKTKAWAIHEDEFHIEVKELNVAKEWKPAREWLYISNHYSREAAENEIDKLLLAQRRDIQERIRFIDKQEFIIGNLCDLNNLTNFEALKPLLNVNINTNKEAKRQEEIVAKAQTDEAVVVQNMCAFILRRISAYYWGIFLTTKTGGTKLNYDLWDC